MPQDRQAQLLDIFCENATPTTQGRYPGPPLVHKLRNIGLVRPSCPNKGSCEFKHMVCHRNPPDHMLKLEDREPVHNFFRQQIIVVGYAAHDVKFFEAAGVLDHDMKQEPVQLGLWVAKTKTGTSNL